MQNGFWSIHFKVEPQRETLFSGEVFFQTLFEIPSPTTVSKSTKWLSATVFGKAVTSKGFFLISYLWEQEPIFREPARFISEKLKCVYSPMPGCMFSYPEPFVFSSELFSNPSLPPTSPLPPLKLLNPKTNHKQLSGFESVWTEPNV